VASILVVDDHPANRDLLMTVVGSAGHTVWEADGSETALAIARRERPELIISDILMPGVDGFEFIKRLRTEPELAATRVVFYTATYLEDEVRQLAVGCGVEHFLFKPCEPEQILETVRVALNAGATVVGPLGAGVDRVAFDREHMRLLNDKLIGKIDALETLNHRNQQLNTDLRASERDVLAAEDAERRRWARELHDETLQALGGLRVLLASARRTGDPAALGGAADLAITQIETSGTRRAWPAAGARGAVRSPSLTQRPQHLRQSKAAKGT
jgi:CheY-like chemotaxis protein